jgi:TFIIF-interacting CTD phosphatase-like protein
VDNLSHNFRLQAQNGIEIKSWYGDKKDRELEKLEKVLIKII